MEGAVRSGDTAAAGVLGLARTGDVSRPRMDGAAT
jgi:hypothetical protein